MKLPFVKFHGCGNDFVLIDGIAHPRTDWPSLAHVLCDRRRGIGGDGLLVILRPLSKSAAATMAMFNPDGSESEMCGNGLRCVGKYLFDRERAGREMIVDTRPGPIAMRVETLDPAGRATELSLAIGSPEFARARVPMAGPSSSALDEPFELAGRSLRITALNLGNPHCVVFVDDVERFPVQHVGPAIEHDPRFPERVNVEFVQVLAQDELLQRTWERGAGETLACGSGATAAAVAARKVRGFGPDVRVRLRGGELSIHWPGDGHPARLRGPAVEVFEGVF